MGKKGFAVFVELVSQGAEESANLFLPRFPGLDFLLSRGGVFLGAGGEVFEAALVVEPGEAFGAGLEVQPQRAFDGDLVAAEIFVVENLADDALALDGLVGDGVFLGEGARLAVAEVAEDFGEFADVAGVFLERLKNGTPVVWERRWRMMFFALGLDGGVFLERGGLRRRENATEAAQDGERQDDLAVFVPLVGPAQEIADAPDEAGELGMGFGGH